MQDLARKLSSAVNLEEVMQTGRMTLETQLQTKVWISIRDKVISSDIELNDKRKSSRRMVFETQAAMWAFYRYAESVKLVVLPLFRTKIA